MKTALVHYWLTNMRGGEKVLSAFGEMFPDADIFTHAYIPSNVPEFAQFKVRESFIAKLPLGRKHPQAYLPLMPTASRSFNFDGYDLILSSESGPIKGIRKPKDARHVCYCHTPMRYVWDMYEDYYRSAGFGGKIAMRLFTPYMRKEDLKSAESVDAFVANSAFVAERIKRIYGRESKVVHPPVDVEFFSQAGGAPEGIPFAPKEYYLYVGELNGYKRPDFAVDACLKMNRNLVVVGAGKMRESLQRRVGDRDNVIFCGRASGERLRAIYSNARALLFPGIEDFGIVPVEAQAAGTPVIARGAGGALETVVSGKTGCFFEEDSVSSLCSAIETFEASSWDADVCRKNTLAFSASRFKEKMTDCL